MIKSNLPVILLKGLVLLPHEETRIELNNDITKKIIDLSSLYHDSRVLVVTPINTLEEMPDTNDLPRVGVTAVITSKITLPNGNIRIVLKGERRVKVVSYVNYSNEKDVLESIIINAKEEEYNIVEETALLRKLITELDKYISLSPYISNSILSKIKGIDDLDKLTDLIANFLPLNYDKKLSLMLEANRLERARKLITEINVELAVVELEEKIENELKKNLDEMQKEMILKERMKAIKKELGEKDTKSIYIDEIKEKINDNFYPENILKRINSELEKYEMTPEISPELATTRSYIDYITRIPFTSTVNTETSLNKIKDSLDKSHYGMEEIKTRIIEYIAVKTNSKANPPIICLVGPPGVGKTTLASSIAASLNKKFIKISLGGLNDPNELLGHRKTYIGSSPGKIINALIEAETNDPVILLDEIDKISSDYKGDPTGALLDILDNNQNKIFRDNFIEEAVDISNVTWIITANDLNMIPYVLLDRLETIELSSYLSHEKIKIANEYLIKTIKKSCGIDSINVNFSEEALSKIINEYTSEAGVRNLERQIDKIIRKVITNSKLKNIPLRNINITSSDVELYLGESKISALMPNNNYGYIKALSYSPLGGKVLEIEVTSYKGEKEFITSGSLGESLEESIKVALSYIKSNLKYFNIDPSLLEKTIHLNFRNGGIKKDGPSAGIAITTAIISHLKKKKIPGNISMTGEITLLGDILEIGGLREKSASSIKDGITKIYIPYENTKDINKIDTEIKEKITFIPVKNYKDIYKDLFKGDKHE